MTLLLPQRPFIWTSGLLHFWFVSKTATSTVDVQWPDWDGHGDGFRLGAHTQQTAAPQAGAAQGWKRTCCCSAANWWARCVTDICSASWFIHDSWAAEKCAGPLEIQDVRAWKRIRKKREVDQEGLLHGLVEPPVSNRGGPRRDDERTHGTILESPEALKGLYKWHTSSFWWPTSGRPKGVFATSFLSYRWTAFEREKRWESAQNYRSSKIGQEASHSFVSEGLDASKWTHHSPPCVKTLSGILCHFQCWRRLGLSLVGFPFFFQPPGPGPVQNKGIIDRYSIILYSVHPSDNNPLFKKNSLKMFDKCWCAQDFLTGSLATLRSGMGRKGQWVNMWLSKLLWSGFGRHMQKPCQMLLWMCIWATNQHWYFIANSVQVKQLQKSMETILPTSIVHVFLFSFTLLVGGTSKVLKFLFVQVSFRKSKSKSSWGLQMRTWRMCFSPSMRLQVSVFMGLRKTREDPSQQHQWKRQWKLQWRDHHWWWVGCQPATPVHRPNRHCWHLGQAQCQPRHLKRWPAHQLFQRLLLQRRPKARKRRIRKRRKRKRCQRHPRSKKTRRWSDIFRIAQPKSGKQKVGREG